MKQTLCCFYCTDEKRVKGEKRQTADPAAAAPQQTPSKTARRLLGRHKTKAASASVSPVCDSDALLIHEGSDVAIKYICEISRKVPHIYDLIKSYIL